MARIRVETVHGPARREIIKGLRAFNTPFLGKSDARPLTITAREGKDIVAGLTGRTSLGWLYVDVLWVSDERRRKGLGRALMAKAEAEARKRGVRNAWLNTFSFQARPFYRKLGYKEFARLKDFPVGHSFHWMMKAL